MANNVIYFRFLKQFKTGIEKPRFKAEADRLWHGHNGSEQGLRLGLYLADMDLELEVSELELRCCRTSYKMDFGLIPSRLVISYMDKFRSSLGTYLQQWTVLVRHLHIHLNNSLGHGWAAPHAACNIYLCNPQVFCNKLVNDCTNLIKKLSKCAATFSEATEIKFSFVTLPAYQIIVVWMIIISLHTNNFLLFRNSSFCQMRPARKLSCPCGSHREKKCAHLWLSW